MLAPTRGLAPTPLAVIIPTRNAGSTLARTLSSLWRSENVSFTVVIVDGGSTDDTLSIALGAGHGTIVLSGAYGRSAARRAGVGTVDSPNVLFLDADQTVPPGLLAEGVVRLSNGGADALVVPEHVEGVGIWTRCAELDRRLFDSDELRYPRFFRREFYERIGGHAVGLEDYMEDRDLTLRAKAAAGRIATTSGSIANLADHLNPLALGRRGARAARDAGVYYARNRAGGESLRTVVTSRFRAFIRRAPTLREDPVASIVLGLFMLVAHGPRLLAVLVAG